MESTEVPKRVRATVTVLEEPGGLRVVIEYQDGHTVRLSVATDDSPILRMHLGDNDGG